MSVVTCKQLEGLTGSPLQLRQLFGCFPSGVVAICGEIDGKPDGIVASSFTAVSIDPPLVSICVQHTSNTWPQLRSRATLGVSVLGASHEVACRQIAGKGERFDGLAWTRTDTGAVLVEDAVAWMECRLVEEVRAGDHDIALLEILSCEYTSEVNPLVFYASTFRELAT